MTKTTIIFLLVQISSWCVNAQDIHFSQIESSPLTLNPALAGVNSPIQAIVNYRSQWKSVESPFKTFAASFDVRLNEKNRNKSGLLVAGINFANDQAGTSKLNTNNANVSLGYHLLIMRKSSLGIALNAGFGQRSLDPNSGRWGSQYNGKAYDPSLPSGETFSTNSFSFFDAGLGMVYAYHEDEEYLSQNNRKSFNAGVAFYHVNRPNYSFLNNSSEKLDMRATLFANANIGNMNSKWSYLPGIYYQLQGQAQELLLGASVKYAILESSKITSFNKGSFISFGTFFRAKDAIIVKAMLEWSDYSLGLAYDLNVSSLRSVSNGRGSAELMLRYNMGSSFLWK